MNIIYRVIAVISAAMTLTSCTDDSDLKPNVTGKAGEIIIVTDKESWKSSTGNSVRNALAVDYPKLPQKEPLFTLYDIQPSAFTNLFKTHRNILILNTIPDLAKPSFVLQKDVWAKPQTIVTASARDSRSLDSLISANTEKLRSIFEQAERDRIISNSKTYEEYALRISVTDMLGGSPYFPNGYKLKKQTDDFIWIAYETTYTLQGIFAYKYPRTEDTRLDLQSIIEKRNEVLKENVPGMFENTYMTTSRADMPDLNWIKYNRRDFAEVRGLWDVENDFMGGPFISHTFYDRSGENVIVLEGFVYAPKYDKRNYFRQVESILYSFEWGE